MVNLLELMNGSSAQFRIGPRTEGNRRTVAADSKRRVVRSCPSECWWQTSARSFFERPVPRVTERNNSGYAAPRVCHLSENSCSGILAGRFKTVSEKPLPALRSPRRRRGYLTPCRPGPRIFKGDIARRGSGRRARPGAEHLRDGRLPVRESKPLRIKTSATRIESFRKIE